jgi:hypothetical protein
VTAGKLGGCTWPGVPLPQKREDGGGDDDAEGNAGGLLIRLFVMKRGASRTLSGLRLAGGV